MSDTIGANVLTQVGFIIRHLDAARKKLAEFFGVEVPANVSGEYAYVDMHDSLKCPIELLESD